MNELEEQNQQEKIFNHKCGSILEQAKRAGLEFEVVYSAFKHKEQFPKASLLECLQVGADEWDV